MGLEDLLQAARCGALEVAASFTGKRSDGNTARAPGFPAYASQFILNEVSEAVRLSGLLVVAAEDVRKRKSRASDADIATADSWTITQELDAPTDEGYAMQETVAAPEAADPDLAMDFGRALLALNDQERRVSRGVLNDETMTDVAVALGVTPSRVTKIKTSACAKLSPELESYRKS